jgi:predicted small secreted protein
MRARNVAEFAALAIALLIAACNTMEGVGEDAQSAGNAIDNAAENSH